MENALQANHFKETASIVGAGQTPGTCPRNKAGFQEILRVNMNVPTHAGSHKNFSSHSELFKTLQVSQGNGFNEPAPHHE